MQYQSIYQSLSKSIEGGGSSGWEGVGLYLHVLRLNVSTDR